MLSLLQLPCRGASPFADSIGGSGLPLRAAMSRWEAIESLLTAGPACCRCEQESVPGFITYRMAGGLMTCTAAIRPTHESSDRGNLQISCLDACGEHMPMQEGCSHCQQVWQQHLIASTPTNIHINVTGNRQCMTAPLALTGPVLGTFVSRAGSMLW